MKHEKKILRKCHFCMFRGVLRRNVTKIELKGASSRSSKVQVTSERVSKHFWYYFFYLMFVFFFLLIEWKGSEL